jgi:hypothetical protein
MHNQMLRISFYEDVTQNLGLKPYRIGVGYFISNFFFNGLPFVMDLEAGKNYLIGYI